MFSVADKQVYKSAKTFLKTFLFCVQAHLFQGFLLSN